MQVDVMSLALRQQAALGEGLVWDQSRQCWWWTDIEAAMVYCWDGVNSLQSWRAPDRVGSLVLCQSGALLLGMSKRIGLARKPSEGDALEVEFLAAVDSAEPRTRINDGRVDRAGNYVFGTLNESTDRRPIGSFYQFSRRFGLRRLALPAVSIANSICFSPDGATMYFSDTLQGIIQQCDYDAVSAKVSRIRHFARPDILQAAPDGAIVDREGCVWNAEWGSGTLARYNVRGELLMRVALPVPQPTCPAIGGAQLNRLLVTSARCDLDRDDLARWPLSGSVFGCMLEQPLGLEDALFNDIESDNELSI